MGLLKYYGDTIQRLQRTAAALQEAQRKIGKLPAHGIDPQAARLVAVHERLLGDQRLMIVEYSEWEKRQQAQLKRSLNPNPADFMEFVVPLVAAAYTGGASALLLSASKEVLKMDEEAKNARIANRNQWENIHKFAIDVEKDKIAFETVQSQVAPLLSAKYPELDWSFVVR